MTADVADELGLSIVFVNAGKEGRLEELKRMLQIRSMGCGRGYEEATSNPLIGVVELPNGNGCYHRFHLEGDLTVLLRRQWSVLRGVPQVHDIELVVSVEIPRHPARVRDDAFQDICAT